MKRSFGLAFFGMCLAGSALAADGTIFSPTSSIQADVDLSGGIAQTNGVDGRAINYDDLVIGAAARANVPTGNLWNLQADLQFMTFTNSGYADTEAAHYLHFYKRVPNDYAVGVFGGFSNPASDSVHMLGVEVQKYLGPWTLYGQGAYLLISERNATSNAFLFRGQASYYPTPNFGISGDLMYTAFSNPFINDTLTVALTGKYRFTDSPFGIFAQARWDHLFWSSAPYLGNDFRGLAGVRINVDPRGSTAESHERTGPAMDVLPPLVNYYSESC